MAGDRLIFRYPVVYPLVQDSNGQDLGRDLLEEQQSPDDATTVPIDNKAPSSPTHSVKHQEIRVSTTPDVPPGTEIWLAPASDVIKALETEGIKPDSVTQKITLGHFPIKLSLPMASEKTPAYRIALVLDSDQAPPALNSAMWKIHHKGKLIVTGMLLKQLALKG